MTWHNVAMTGEAWDNLTDLSKPKHARMICLVSLTSHLSVFWKTDMAGSIVRSQVGLPVTKEEEAAAVAAVRDMLGPDQQVLVSVSVSIESCISWATPGFYAHDPGNECGEVGMCERGGGVASQWDPHHTGGGGGQSY